MTPDPKSSSSDDPAEGLRRDLRARWEAGDRVPVETYLARLPAGSTDAAVDLIYTEYLLREQAGEPTDTVVFLARFPEHAAVLRDQFAFHHAMDTPVAPSMPAGSDVARGIGPLPATLGRYTLVKVLGRGGMGVVYLADDATLGRKVALKLLRLDAADPLAVARFRREAQTAAGLAHPNLCPVYDVGRVDGLDYLTMPYLPGETLAARVARVGPLPADEAVRLTAQVAAAMEAAHAAGVVHRDLKPSNVILGDGDEPIVMDFGLARRSGAEDARLTASGAVMGTPAYMPPEQVGCAPEAVGPASDVYSLGALLFELLTGRPPYLGSPGEVLLQVLDGRPPAPSSVRPGVPPWLDAVCRTALAMKPADRFPSMAAFADALATRTAPRPPRRVARWAALVAGVVVLLGVGVFAAWPPRSGVTAATVPTAPAPPPPEPFVAGAEWVGEFHFLDDRHLPVRLVIHKRDGDAFTGEYSTENRYRWAVAGTVAGNDIRWTLSAALNDDAASTGATERGAELNGTLIGLDLKATYHEADNQSRAEMVLRRR